MIFLNLIVKTDYESIIGSIISGGLMMVVGFSRVFDQWGVWGGGWGWWVVFVRVLGARAVILA